jgi:glycosyltransferase involved in cell wall biosynthesis
LNTTYPKITVITPSFNQGSYIEETIQSVVSQNYPNLQYIIMDGGSTDNTVDVIKKYQGKIDHWVSEKDSGQSNAINKGLKLATGDIVNWLNSDDQLADNALFDIARLYNANPNCGVFIGQTDFFSKEIHYGTGGRVVFNTREMTFAFGQVNQPAMFYKKTSLQKMGFLNESLHYCMDIDWWLKYLLYFAADTIAETTTIWAKFRFHDSSKTLVNPLEFKKEKYRIYKKIFQFYGFGDGSENNGIDDRNYPASTTLNLKKARNYYYLWRSDELMIEKKKLRSFRFWFKVNPLKLENSEKKRYLAILKNNLLTI